MGSGDPVSPPEMLLLAKYARRFFRAAPPNRPKILSEAVQILQVTWPRWNCRTVRVWFNNHEQELMNEYSETATSDVDPSPPSEQGQPMTPEQSQQSEAVPVEQEPIHAPQTNEQEISAPEKPLPSPDPPEQPPQVTLPETREEVTTQPIESTSTNNEEVTVKSDTNDEPPTATSTDNNNSGSDTEETRRRRRHPIRRAKFRETSETERFKGKTQFSRPPMVPQTTASAQQVFTIAPVVTPVPVLTAPTVVMFQPTPYQGMMPYGSGDRNLYMMAFLPQQPPQNLPARR